VNAVIAGQEDAENAFCSNALATATNVVHLKHVHAVLECTCSIFSIVLEADVNLSSKCILHPY
jgi:hypothetical protein